MQSSLPSLILLRVFQTHPCENPPENYVIRKACIIHNCVMVFSRILVPRIKKIKQMSDSICMATEYWTRFHSIFVKNLIVQSNIKKYWIKRKLWGNLIFHEVLRFLTSLFRFVIHFTYIKTKSKNNDFPMFSTPNINILIRYVVILLLHERVCIIPLCVTNGSINSLTVV